MEAQLRKEKKIKVFDVDASDMFIKKNNVEFGIGFKTLLIRNCLYIERRKMIRHPFDSH